MSSYPPPLPPAGTYQPEQITSLRPETNRSRANSATADRYRPGNYSQPPSNQPNPTLPGPNQNPYAAPDPTVYTQQYPQRPQQPPYPDATAYPQAHPLPMPQPAPIYTSPPPTISGPASRHNSHARPPAVHPDDPRRHSYSSQMSRHSHSSRHSRDSKRSHRSRLSADEKLRRAHAEHPNRTNERPTMGDSLVSVFGLIKRALGPRDK